MIKIAWRNVLRNKRRTLLSVIIITVGVAVLALFNGYKNATFWGIRDMSIRENGNFQIAKVKYWDNKDDERHLISPDEMIKIKEILSSYSPVINFTNQLNVSGILGNESKSTIVTGNGIGAEGADKIDYNEVYLGKGIMQRLGLKEKDQVSLLAMTLDDSFNAGNLQVAGSFSTGFSDADNAYISLSLEFAQSLLNTQGVDRFLVFLDEPEQTESAILWVKAQLAKAGLTDVGIRNWQELSPTYQSIKSVFDLVFTFMAIIIFILVLLSILEIMSMAFFERINEIGTVRAIGTKQSQVFLMFGEEGLIIGLFACLIGSILGWGSAIVINMSQINYMAPGFNTAVPLYISTSFNDFVIPCIVILVAIMISTFYPALKASKLNIVEVLRHL